MIWNQYKKWLAFGSGIGIEIGERDLSIVLARVRPNGASVTATLVIENYATRPANEWGAEYSAFVRKNGATHMAANILLPRKNVIVRHLAMPGVAEQDLENAVRFQIDGLHPYNEDEALYDWGRLDGSSDVLVGITRREIVERFSTLLAEAGIKVAAFSYSAAVVYSSLRLYGPVQAGGFLTVERHDGTLEAYGESDARPVFSATFDTPSEPFADRAIGLALSELRLPAATLARPTHNVLPPPRQNPPDFDIAADSLPYAAALNGACPHLCVSANLLPPEQRVTSSRAMYVPSIALAVLLLLTIGAYALYSTYEDRKYLQALQAEIKHLAPIARKPMAIDREIAVTRQRAQLLDSFRRRSQADLDALNELTRLIPPPGWAMGLDLQRDQIRITGETDQAAGLLKVLDKSPFFEGSDFALPMARISTGETYSIRSRREGVLP